MIDRRAPIVLTEADINEIQRLYEVEKWGVRRIADQFNTNHHFIQRRVNEYGFVADGKRIKKPLSDEHKRKIGESRRRLAEKGFHDAKISKKTRVYNTSEEKLVRNMETHLLHEVSNEWLHSFEDIEKLKFLNRVISRHRKHFDLQKYTAFIEKFYYDDQFNKVYSKWILNDKDKWLMPSIDHIVPKALGGTFDLCNLQFLTWFENRAKADMSPEDWKKVKANIGYYLTDDTSVKSIKKNRNKSDSQMCIFSRGLS